MSVQGKRLFASGKYEDLDSVNRKESQLLHHIEALACICECLGMDDMVVCVSVSLHNTQVLACVTITKCYAKTLLIWLFLLLSSQFLFKMP